MLYSTGTNEIKQDGCVKHRCSGFTIICCMKGRVPCRQQNYFALSMTLWSRCARAICTNTYLVNPFFRKYFDASISAQMRLLCEEFFFIKGTSGALSSAGLWIRIRNFRIHCIYLLDPDPHSICGSGSRMENFEEKTEKKMLEN